MQTDSKPEHYLDAVVVGGGIAGLWTLNRLVSSGYNAILLEADRLGCQQTLASQGMIHGGLKYALAGALTGASEAIAAMPDRWRAALAGDDEVDLSGLEVACEHYYLYAAAGTLGRLTGFFASKALRGRIHRLKPAAYPTVLTDPAFKGVVYQLNDFVLDVQNLLSRLSANVSGRIGQLRITPDNVSLDGSAALIDLGDSRLRTNHLILCAGIGNEALIDHLNLKVATQRRPLHQVVVRHPDLQPFFAHCITGTAQAEPRITISSVPVDDGWVWYLGGQLATRGVTNTDVEQVHHARRELTACVPWIDWQNARITTFRIDRAEPQQSRRRRPDEASVSRVGPCILAWPTKLTLAPDLGDRVMACLDPPGNPEAMPSDLTPVPIDDYPWLG